MNQYFRVSCAALMASFLLSLGMSGQVVRRLAQVPSSGVRVALPNSVSERIATAERLGSLPDDTALNGLSLVLKPSEAQDAALTQLLADQQDPSKPSYHQWLTPQQYGERFGIADADLTVLQAWLQQAGLHVDEVAASRNSIRFSGNAADVAAAFGTAFGRYRSGAQTYRENSAPVELPAGLAAVVQGVSGLSSYRSTAHMVRSSAQQLATGNASSSNLGSAAPQYTTTGTSGTVHYLVPWDFRQIYGINTLISSGFDGTGIKIGVIGQSAVNTQQLTYFQGKIGQAVKMPTMVLVPSSGVSNLVAGDEAESELDVEYASGSAPGAAVQFIYTGCTATASSTELSNTTDCGNNGVYTALAYAVTNNLAPILTLSYGECESSATLASTTLEPILKQANAQGQTVIVASGDGGAAACDQTGGLIFVASHGLAVQYPSSSTYVTAVGGTQLNSDSAADWSSSNNGSLGSASGYMAETTWNDTPTSRVIEASTGGVSKIYQMPAWQQPYKQPQAYFRMVPDIAFASSLVFHPYMVCLGDGACTSGTGGFTPGRDGTGVGGTSLAAPNFAAMLAVVEQANGGGALGNVNPALYTLAAGKSAAAVFHDVVTGNNIVACQVSSTFECLSTGSMGYSAGVGYDLTTGFGSVDAAGLRAALKSLPARTATLSLRASPQTIDITSPEVGLQFSVVLDAFSNSTVVPTGGITFEIDGVAQTSAPTLFNGEALGQLSLNTLGAHTITATYAGDVNFDAASTSIVVTPIQAPPQISLNVSGFGVPLNSPVPLRASVSAGTVTPTGTLTFVVDGVVASPPVALVSGFAGFQYPGFSTAGQHTVVATYSGDALITTGSSRAGYVTIAAATQTQTATVTVTASTQTPSIGVPVTLSAVVKSATATSTTAPTGFVTFSVDGVTLPTVALNASGQASASYTFTAMTFSGVTATYSGDSLYNGNLGNLSLSVPYPPTPSVALALSTTAVSIPSTGTASVGLNISSVTGFSGPVSITASLVYLTGASFSGCYVVSPGVVFPTPATPGTATLSMALASNSLCTKSSVTRMQSVASSGTSPMQSRVPWAAVAVAGMFGCVVFRRRLPSGLLAVLVLSLALAANGCSGSGGSSAGTTTTTPPTTPVAPAAPTAGTYAVTITARAQTTGVSSTGTFTLTVQ
jgi:hypothetical protein